MVHRSGVGPDRTSSDARLPPLPAYPTRDPSPASEQCKLTSRSSVVCLTNFVLISAPYSPMAAAQRALNQTTHNVQPERSLDYRPTASQPAPLDSSSANAKECMLKGHMYNPSDSQLVKDRERSRMACNRFNTQAFTGSSVQETERCFRLIVEPETNISPTSYLSPTERVGKNLRVEAPFRCEYGYNLRMATTSPSTVDVFSRILARYTLETTPEIGPNVTVCGETTPQALTFRDV